MKPSHIVVVLTTLALLFTFILTPVRAEESSEPIVKVVKSVDAASNKIEIEFSRGDRHIVRSYTLSSSASVTLNNSTGTLAQVKPGMVVNELAPKEGPGLDRLSVSDKQ